MKLSEKTQQLISWGEPVKLKTKNISLAPCSIFDKKRQRFEVVWYEYGSDQFPKPSSIWFSYFEKNNFSRPKKIVGAKGFNNGPRICSFENTQNFLAWHSWRPPGELPFKKEGVSNIWLSSLEGGRIGDEFLALPDERNTSYPCIVLGPDKKYWMTYISRDGLSLGFAKSTDGISWKVESSKIFDFAVTESDLAVAPDNTVWMVMTRKTKNGSEVWITSNADYDRWKEPQKILDLEHKPARPRISFGHAGRFWLTWHSDFWDPSVIEYDIEIKRESLTQTIETSKTPGNYCWVWNGIEIQNLISKESRTFSFVTESAESKGETNEFFLNPKNCRYQKSRGYGFNGAVKAMCRIKGQGITKEMFYSPSKRSFIVDLPSGKYKVKNWISSWISSQKDFTFKVETDVKQFRLEKTNPTNEKIFVATSLDGNRWSEIQSTPMSGGEASRPSKIIHIDDSHYRLFWTGIDSSGINIWTNDFKFTGE